MEQLDSKIWFFSFSGIPTAEICPPNSPSPQPGISKNQASGEMLMGCTMGKAVVTGTASLSSRSPGQQVEGESVGVLGRGLWTETSSPSCPARLLC